MRRTISEAVNELVSEDLIHFSGLPRTIVSDTASCFTPKALGSFINRNEMEWKHVMAYDQM